MATRQFAVGSDSENEKETQTKRPARTSRFREGEASFEMRPIPGMNSASSNRENTPFPGTGAYPLPSAPPPRTFTPTPKELNPFSKHYHHSTRSTTMPGISTNQETFHNVSLADKNLPERAVGQRSWGVSRGYIIAFAVNLVVFLVLIVLVAILMHAWLKCRRDNTVRILQ